MLFIKNCSILLDGYSGVTEVGQWLQKGYDLQVEKSSKLYLLPLQFNKTEPVLARTSLGVPKKISVQEDQHPHLELKSSQANKLSIVGYHHGIQAETLYAKGALKEARQEQVEALLLAHHFQDSGLLIPMYVLSCKLYMINGEIEKAHETVRSALIYTEDSYWKNFLYALEAFLYLKQDGVKDAEDSFSRMRCNYEECPHLHPFVALVEARILLKQGQWKKALENILAVKFEALEEGQIMTLIEATILESSCYAYKEYWSEMAQSLQEAMMYSKEYGYTQLFMEEDHMESMLKEYVQLRKEQHDRGWAQVPNFFVERLIQATKAKSPILELLTPREQEVFSLLVLGETNHKIAKNLALTEGTVRIYLTSIYEKLSVNSRTQAMLKAYK